MILRRFMKHVTDQNWFAVGLDVIVVIVGIFLGLQVQAWYGGREAEKEEGIYLQQLHDEVEQVSARVNRNVPLRREILDELESAVNILTGKQIDGDLGADHCRAVTQSHIYLNLVGSLATITEIQNNNRSSEFTNDQITKQITQYILFLERWDALIESISEGKVEMSNDFPDLVRVSSNADIRSTFNENNDYNCDFEKIRTNNTFINHLYSNSRRYRVFNDFLSQQSSILTRLHELLDQEISITHAGESL